MKIPTQPGSSLLPTVIGRLGKLLPIETGLTISEVKAEPLYDSTRKCIVKLAPHTTTLIDIVYGFLTLLEGISRRDKYSITRKKSAESLSSINLVLELLQECCDTHWHHIEPAPLRTEVRTGLQYHTVAPEPLPGPLVKTMLDMLIRLKSHVRTVEEANFLAGYEKNADETADFPHRQLILSIDAHTESLLRFFSASNWPETLDCIVSRLNTLKFYTANDSDIVPAVDLVGSLFLDESSLLMLLKEVWNLYSQIRRSNHQLLLLSFLSHSLMYWINAKPAEYARCCASSSAVGAEASGLFDYIVSSGEGADMADATRPFLALLLCLTPMAFAAYFAESVLKNYGSFGKKVRFLTAVVADLEELAQPGGLIQERVGPAGETRSIGSGEASIASGVSALSAASTGSGPSSEPSSGLSAISNLTLNPEAGGSGSGGTGSGTGSSVASPEEPFMKLSRSVRHVRVTLRVFTIFVAAAAAFPGRDDMSPLLYAAHQFYPALFRVFYGRTYPLTPEMSHLKTDFALGYLQIPDSQIHADLDTALRNADRDDLRFLFTVAELSLGVMLIPQIRPVYAVALEHNAEYLKQSLQRQAERLVESAPRPPQAAGIPQYPAVVRSIVCNLFGTFALFPEVYFAASDFRNLEAAKAAIGPVITSLGNSDPTVFAAASEFLFAFIGIQRLDADKEGENQKSGTATADKEDVTKATAPNTDLPATTACSASCPASSSACSSLTTTYVASGYVVATLARCTMDFPLVSPKIRDFTRLILQFLKARAYIARRLGPQVGTAEDAESREKLYTVLEACLLVLLCSADLDVLREVRQCIAFVLEEGLATENPETFSTAPNSFLHNLEPYLEIVSPGYVVTGLVALQKRLRHVFGVMRTPTPGILAAWHEVFRRWDGAEDQGGRSRPGIGATGSAGQTGTSSASVTGPPLTPTPTAGDGGFLAPSAAKYGTGLRAEAPPVSPQVSAGSASFAVAGFASKESRNYAGFLAAFCGCLLQPHSGAEEASLRETWPLVDRLIESLVSKLGSPSLAAREGAKSVLASEMSVLAFPTVFRQLERLTTRHEQLVASDCLLLDQVISVLKSLVEQCVRHGKAVAVDLVALSFQMAQLLHELDSPTVVRLKIRFCSLCVLMEAEKESLKLRSSLKIRNRFVRVIADWFGDSLARVVVEEDLEKAAPAKRLSELDHMYVDLSVEAIKALALMLDGLVLDPSAGGPGAELRQTKAVSFCSYFNLLLGVFRKIAGLDLEAGAFSVYRHKLATVAEFIIKAATNLLRHNVDVGLPYALPLGFNDDVRIRSAFIHVFTNIVEQGTASVASQSQDERYRALAEFLASRPRVCVALCELCPAGAIDALAVALLNVLDGHGAALEVVAAAVRQEILRSQRSTEMLRRNSVATRMLSLYARRHGGEYLQSVLRPFFGRFLAAPAEHMFETNPEKVAPEAMAGNVARLRKSLDDLVSAIVTSEAGIPGAFRRICREIRQVVETKFPESSLTQVGSFMFLRFFCPALVAPESEGLLEQAPTKEVRRTLLQLAKIVQNLANGPAQVAPKNAVLDGERDVLLRSAEQIMGFLDRVSAGLEGKRLEGSGEQEGEEVKEEKEMKEEKKDKEKERAKEAEELEEETREQADTKKLAVPDASVASVGSTETSRTSTASREDIMYLHQFLYDHWDELHRLGTSESAVAAGYLPGGAPADDPISAADFAVLDPLLESLGQPDTLALPAGGAAAAAATAAAATFGDPHESGTASASRFQQFMRRMAAQDSAPPREPPDATEAVTRDGTPSVVVSVPNLYSAETSRAVFLYHVLQIICKLWHSKYDFVMDCTGLVASRTAPANLFGLLEAVAPVEGLSNCQMVHFVNVSSDYVPLLREVLRAMEASMVPYLVRCDFSVCSDGEGSGSELPVPLSALSRTTRGMLADPREVFTDCFVHEANGTWVPLTLRLGDRYVQLSRREATTLHLGPEQHTVHPVDIWPLAELSAAYVAPMADQPHALTLEFAGLGRSVALSYPRPAELLRALRRAKARLGAPPPAEDAPPVQRVQDTLGYLLNVALVALDSEVPEIRGGAFGLLAALRTRFSLSLGRHVAAHGAVHVPVGQGRLVVAVSEALALHHGELSYDFLSAAITCCEGQDKKRNVAEYMAPWLKNVAPYVLHVEELGAARASELVRRMVKLAVAQPELGSGGAAGGPLWTRLCLEAGLTEIVVREAVAVSVEREVAGLSWEPLVALLAGCPTVEVGGQLVARLKQVTSAAVPAGTEMSWGEAIVVAQMAVAVFFDNGVLAELFLGDVLFAVTILLDLGPPVLRQTVLQLLINVCHAFLCSDALPAGATAKVTALLDDLSGQRTRLLFGVNQTAIDYRKEVYNKVSGYEQLCHTLLAFTGLVGSAAQAAVWRSRWASEVIAVAFKPDALVRPRAFLVLGFITEAGVSDLLVAAVLRELAATLRQQEQVAGELEICIVHCLRRFVQGLAPNSRYFGKLMWLGLALSQCRAVGMYNVAVELVGTVVETMAARGVDVEAELKAERAASGFEVIEQICGVRYEPEYLDCMLCMLLVGGLHRSSTRHSTLKTLRVLLRVRSQAAPEGAAGKAAELSGAAVAQQLAARGVPACTPPESRETNNPKAFPYLLIMYLYMRDPAELQQELTAAGCINRRIHPCLMAIGVPEAFVDYIVRAPGHVLCAFFTAALLFCQDSADEGMQAKFAVALHYVGMAYPDFKFLVYFDIRPRLRAMCRSVPGGPLLAVLHEVIAQSLADERFQYQEQYMAVEAELLEAAGLNGQLEYFLSKWDEAVHGAEWEKQLVARLNVLCSRLLSTATLLNV